MKNGSKFRIDQFSVSGFLSTVFHSHLSTVARGRFVAVLLLLLPSIALAANPCANGGSPAPVIQRGPGDEGGVGGTGVDDAQTAGSDREGGIGGTGVEPDDDEGGIGGTGIAAETAVIGTVTGFASICVGGTEI